MAAAVNLELDPIFLKALGFLHSKSKDSAEKLKTLLDESLARGIDSSYRPSQKDVEPPKISSTKTVSVKQEPKTSSSLPSGNNNGKVLTTEKVKKEGEKRPADKMKSDITEGADVPKKPRLEKPETRSSPITVQTSKDLAMADLSSFEETSADDFAMEMGLACVVCRQMTVASGNQLVECQECHNLYHQDCHKPQVTDKEVTDPRLVWYCARCTRQMKRMAQKTQPHGRRGPSGAVRPLGRPLRRRHAGRNDSELVGSVERANLEDPAFVRPSGSQRAPRPRASSGAMGPPSLGWTLPTSGGPSPAHRRGWCWPGVAGAQALLLSPSLPGSSPHRRSHSTSRSEVFKHASEDSEASLHTPARCALVFSGGPAAGPARPGPLGWKGFPGRWRDRRGPVEAPVSGTEGRVQGLGPLLTCL